MAFNQLLYMYILLCTCISLVCMPFTSILSTVSIYIMFSLSFSFSLSLTIIPVQFICDFLDQYCIPQAVRINDGIWSEFFNVFLDR